MPNRPPLKPESEVLSDPAAARLLERASELDAAGLAVADLRAAAAEAGISAHAFEAALAELRGREQVRVPDVIEQPRLRSRIWAPLVVAVVALVAVGSFAIVRTPTAGNAPATATPAMIEEPILLRCLSPGDAAALIRPHLGPENAIVASPTSPRVLTVRATPAQLQKVRAVLEQYERRGSASCPVPSTPP